MELIVEQISRNGKVKGYVKTANEKIRIGRAYDNDVVLQEEHVDPYHAEIDVYHDDGVIVITDLNSVNGIKTEQNLKLSNSQRLIPGDGFVLGKTKIRILRADQQVAPAKQLSLLEDLISKLNFWYFALAMVVVFWLSILLRTYFTRFDTIIWSKEIASSSFAAAAFIILPILVVISARFFKKEVRFFATTFFCFSALVLLQLVAAVEFVLYFNWPGQAVSKWLASLLQYGVVAALCWGCLYLASSMSMKKISVTTLVLLSGLWGLLFYSHKTNNIVLQPNHYTVVLPEFLLFTKMKTPSEQVKLQKSLFSRAEQEAERLNKSGKI